MIKLKFGKYNTKSFISQNNCQLPCSHLISLTETIKFFLFLLFILLCYSFGNINLANFRKLLIDDYDQEDNCENAET